MTMHQCMECGTEFLYHSDAAACSSRKADSHIIEVGSMFKLRYNMYLVKIRCSSIHRREHKLIYRFEWFDHDLLSWTHAFFINGNNHLREFLNLHCDKLFSFQNTITEAYGGNHE